MVGWETKGIGSKDERKVSALLLVRLRHGTSLLDGENEMMLNAALLLVARDIFSTKMHYACNTFTQRHAPPEEKRKF